MLIGKKITKTYPGLTVLEEVDFKFGQSKKYGLVGKNGCGKSTLFRLIAGIEQPDEGNIETDGEKIGYVPQEFEFPDQMVGEYLAQFLEFDWEFYKVEALLDQLKFSNYDEYQMLNTMSEGQKMKVKLIETLLQEPTLILIDEPTNHLDIEGIFWFESYIKQLDKTVIMISHDRSFLNNTVDEILEIENGKITKFVGNYDHYKGEKLKLIDKMNAEYKLFLKKKAQLEKLLESARKIKDGKKRGRALNSARKRIDREVEANKKEQYIEQKIKDVNFETDTRNSKLMVRFDEVSKSYGEKKVFENLSFELRGKEKIWLLGPNGTGKTSLVKMIMQEENVTSGELTTGTNMKIGYFAQKQTALDYDKTLLDAFIEATSCEYGKAFGFLKRFLFDGASAKKKISELSPGQRARFAFSIFAFNDYDMLILDEPTNHLDIETKEVIERSLSDFEGTLLLVSHDRYFVESVGVDKILDLKSKVLSHVV